MECDSIGVLVIRESLWFRELSVNWKGNGGFGFFVESFYLFIFFG